MPFPARSSRSARRVAVVASALVAGAACDPDTPTVPRNLPTLGELSVTTMSSTETLVIGDTAIITFRFTNPTDTAYTFVSGANDRATGVPCPALLPVAARQESNTVNAFILGPCFGGTDSTLTHQLGTQTVVVPARSTVELEIPFNGMSRTSASATPRCLTVGPTWILPYFFLGGQLLLPQGTHDTDDEPELLYLKPSTTTPAPCTVPTS
jgi:hypothetical protein